MQPSPPHRIGFTALGCACELQFCTPAATAQALAERVIAEVARIECKYSRYRDDSVTSAINRDAGLRATDIDAETAGLLAYGAASHQQSGGRFDLTSGVLRRVWQFREARLPQQAAIARILPLVAWPQVKLTGEQIYLPQAGMEIDFGGIGKEYAVDRAADLCLAWGCRSGMVNLGGDIRVLGPQADGRPWAIGITHPRQPGSTIASMAVDEGAVASSGDYERAIIVDGQRYCHILDPRSGWPVQSFQSVTVYAPRCLVAGSLSTLAMLLGETEGLGMLAANARRWLAVLANGEMRSSADAQ